MSAVGRCRSRAALIVAVFSVGCGPGTQPPAADSGTTARPTALDSRPQARRSTLETAAPPPASVGPSAPIPVHHQPPGSELAGLSLSEVLRRFESQLPHDADALAELAWIVCTADDPRLRDVAAARPIAREVLGKRGRSDPHALALWAAVAAAEGDWTTAEEVGHLAWQAAIQRGDDHVARQIQIQRQQYRQGLAVRRVVSGPAWESRVPAAAVLGAWSQHLVMQGRPADAIDVLEVAAQLDAGNLALRRGLVMLDLSSGQYDQAAVHLEEIVRREPGDAVWRHRLGVVRAQQDRLDEAVTQFQAALRLQPDLQPAAENLVLALIRAGRIGEATRWARHGLQRWPQCVGLANNLAWILATHVDPQQRDPRAAMRLLEPLFAAHPEDVELLDTWAVCLAEQGRFDEALATIERALQAGHQADAELLAKLRRHRRLFQAGKPCRDVMEVGGTYLQDLRRLAADPRDAQAHRRVALRLAEQGDYALAVRHFQTAAVLEPGDRTTVENLCLALLRSGQTEQALDWVRRGLARWPKSADLANNLAWLLATHPDTALRDGTAALHWAEVAVKASGEDAESLDTLAAAYAELVRFDEAQAAAQRAIAAAQRQGRADLAADIRRRLAGYTQRRPYRDQAPHAPRAGRHESSPAAARAADHHQLAIALAEQGHLGAALKELRTAQSLAPDNEAVAVNLALVLLRRGDSPAAIAALREAVERFPQSADLANNLAWLLAAHPDPALRDGPAAVRIVEPFCTEAKSADPALLDTLAAAHAECGQFRRAVALAEQARARAEALGDTALSRRIAAHLAELRQHRPLRDASLRSDPPSP